MVDVVSRLRTCIGEDLLDDVCRHLLEQVRGIVCLQVVDDVRCFLIGEGRNDVLLIVDLELGKDISRHALREDPEHLQGILVLHVVHDRRNIRGLHLRCRLPKLCILLFLKQRGQNLLVLTLFVFHSAVHGTPPEIVV